MSKQMYEELFYSTLTQTSSYVQPADQSTRYIEGVATDLLVKIRNNYVPTDFMILDMGNNKDTPLILGHPFLNTVNACIYMAFVKFQFHFGGKK